MNTPLFDVVLCNTADEKGKLVIVVKLIDRYHDGPDVPKLIGESPEFRSIDDAIEWARRAVTAFMEGTQA